MLYHQCHTMSHCITYYHQCHTMLHYHYHQCHTVSHRVTLSLPPMSHRVTLSLPLMSHRVTLYHYHQCHTVSHHVTLSLPLMSHHVTPCYTVSLTDNFRRLRRSSCAWWLASLRCSTSLPVVDRMLSSRVQHSRSSSSSCSSLAMLWECGGVRVWGCECVCEGVGVCVRGVRGV